MSLDNHIATIVILLNLLSSRISINLCFFYVKILKLSDHLEILYVDT